LNGSASILLLLAITIAASGEESAAIETPTQQKYKVSPDLPNEIAFYMTLQLLDQFNT
jgi:hypothetical protein